MTINFELIILFLVVILIGVTWLVVARVIRSRRQAWEELATRLGMNFTPGDFFGSGMSVSGTYRGHTLTLDKFTVHRGKNNVSYTRIVVHLNQPADLSLAIYQENLFNRLGKALGMREIQTGDEALDQRFIIKGQPEAGVVRLLSQAGLRQRLLEARSVDLRLDGQEIYYQKRGIETNPERLIALFDLVSDLAGAVDRPQI